MMHRMRLLSFNIHGGRSRDGQRDLRRVHDLMDRFDVDIGVFQEMETRPSRGGCAADMDTLAGASRPYRFFGANLKEAEGWFGNLVASRYPLLRSLQHTLETKRKYEPRSAIDVLSETPLGKIRIVGTHLSLSPFERHSQAQQLIELMAVVEREEKNPLLLMGDINEWMRPSKLLRFLDSRMTPAPCKATFPACLPLLRLDRVWYDAQGFRVTAHRLADRQSRVLSDHLPVLVEIARD
ncbi:MAG: endonuclease/exonuclease/phosphatase family protein [Bdellovibrionales bacterium]